MHFRFNLLTRADAYYVIGTNYSDTAVKGTAAKGIKYNMTFGQKAYISIVSNSVLGLDFNIYSWVVNNVGETTVTTVTTVAPTVAPTTVTKAPTSATTATTKAPTTTKAPSSTAAPTSSPT
jgi:hypothetical protein